MTTTPKALQQLLKTTPENLAEQQFNCLKEHVCKVLKEIHGCIEDDKHDALRDMTFESPAGDDMGSDNVCIDFGALHLNGKQHLVSDIGEVLDHLEDLLKIICRIDR